MKQPSAYSVPEEKLGAEDLPQDSFWFPNSTSVLLEEQKHTRMSEAPAREGQKITKSNGHRY